MVVLFCWNCTITPCTAQSAYFRCTICPGSKHRKRLTVGDTHAEGLLPSGWCWRGCGGCEYCLCRTNRTWCRIKPALTASSAAPAQVINYPETGSGWDEMERGLRLGDSTNLVDSSLLPSELPTELLSRPSLLIQTTLNRNYRSLNWNRRPYLLAYIWSPKCFISL